MQTTFEREQYRYDNLAPCDLERKPTGEEIEREITRRVKKLGTLSDAALGLYAAAEVNDEAAIIVTDIFDAHELQLIERVREMIFAKLKLTALKMWVEYADRDY